MVEEKSQVLLKSTISSNFKEPTNFFKVLTNVKFLLFMGRISRDVKEIRSSSESIQTNRKFIKKLKSFIFILGFTIILCVASIAIFQYWLSSIENATQVQVGWYSNLAFAPPSTKHPFGTTFGGLDVFARIVFGTRYTLIVILSSTLLSVAVGTIIGLVSTYYGGWLDMLVMRLIDILMTFPGVVFALLFLIIFGRTFELTIIAFGIIGIPYFSRVVRTCVLKQKELPYVQAAKAIGAKKGRIMFLHILPNCYQPIIVSATLNVGRVLLGLTVLAFLGINRTPFFWGGDIIATINNIYRAPWAIFWPLFMIVITIMGFLFLGDGLRDAFTLKTEQV